MAVGEDNLRLSPGSAVPPDLVEAVGAHKQGIIAVSRLLERLRMGIGWLTETHLGLLEEREIYQGMEGRFVKALDGWDALDAELREGHGYQGCVMGPAGRCPDDSPVSCRGCAGMQVHPQETSQS